GVHAARRMPGRARREFAALDQDDVVPAGLSEMIKEARADDATADHRRPDMGFHADASKPAVTIADSEADGSVVWPSVPRHPHESGRPLGDDGFRLGHGAVDQLLDRGNVMDQPGDHAARPGAGVHLTLFHDAWIDACHFGDDVLELDLRSEFALF